jgi:hypothetical protein
MFRKLLPNREVSLSFLILFVPAVVSLSYTLITGRLNGDFLGYETSVNTLLLVFLFFASVYPFLLHNKYYKNQIIKSIKNTKIPQNKFFIFLVCLMVLNVIFTILFGLGVMTKDAYDAPGGIKIIIQILNRFSYIYGTLLYLISCKKNDSRQVILILLILLLAYLRAGLGVVFYLLMIYSVKYYDNIVILIKKKKIITIFMSLIFPVLINLLYGIRSELRGQQDIEFQDPISGVLAGRLSNFANTVVIVENPVYFIFNMNFTDLLFFQKQGMGGVLGQSFMPEKRPENMMYELFNTTENENVSYMTGTIGILILSFFKNPVIALINLLTIIFLVRLTYFFFIRTQYINANGLTYVLVSYVILSGVSNELFFLCFSGLIYYSLSKLNII